MTEPAYPLSRWDRRRAAAALTWRALPSARRRALLRELVALTDAHVPVSAPTWRLLLLLLVAYPHGGWEGERIEERLAWATAQGILSPFSPALVAARAELAALPPAGRADLTFLLRLARVFLLLEGLDGLEELLEWAPREQAE